MTTTINATPKQGLTRLSTGERLRSKFVTLDLTNTEGEKAGLTNMDGVNDLARDLYHQLVKADPQYVDPLPKSRGVNKEILDFAKGNGYWDQTRNSTVGNMLTAMTAATLLHDALLQDDKMKEALKKQEEGQQSEQEGDQKQRESDALQSAADAMPDGDAKDQTQKQSDQAQTAADAAYKKADHARQQAQQIVGKQLGDGTTKAATRIKTAMKQAAEKSQELADSISGWGSGPGEQIKQDPKAALEYMKRLNRDNRLAQIAKLAGRFKGIALSARTSRIAVGNTPFDATYTQEIQKVFPSELALLAPDAPVFLRAKKAAEFADRGLLGLDTRGEAKEAGPFVCLADVSGSMHGERFLIAKGIGLGIAQVARNEDRHYLLSTFGSESDPAFGTDSKDTWQMHLEWAGFDRGGGTSFDHALTMIMQRLLAFRQAFGEHISDADALILSDGEALVSRKVNEKWQAFKEEHGTRLLFVCVDQDPYEGDDSEWFGLNQIADKTIQVARLDRITGDELAAQIGTWIQ